VFFLPFASRKIQHRENQNSYLGQRQQIETKTQQDLCMYRPHQQGDQNPRDYAASFRMPNSSSGQVVEVSQALA
jgi:hypothetical protein